GVPARAIKRRQVFLGGLLRVQQRRHHHTRPAHGVRFSGPSRVSQTLAVASQSPVMRPSSSLSATAITPPGGTGKVSFSSPVSTSQKVRPAGPPLIILLPSALIATVMAIPFMVRFTWPVSTSQIFNSPRLPETNHL